MRLDLDRIRSFGNSEGPRYVWQAEVREFEGLFGFDAQRGASATTSQSICGHLFRDAEQQSVFQARYDRLIYSKLQPYQSWELVRDEAERLWTAYAEIANPESISHIGLRYVNRLDFPAPVLHLRDWLVTAPTIAPGISQVLAGYTMQLLLPQPDLPRTVAAVTQALVESQSPDRVSIVLDIDMRMELRSPGEARDVWKRIEQLHTRENEVFEASITERTRELFQ